ncbi:hypothetical protein BLJAPNOD_05620 [Ensifer sp. M14]|uniref:hypothetical protein n=1 Tax=Sinorhizobium/Ensifer group TaxID=227292 RepID=UPI000985ACEB|nr:MULTISPECIES: hypothetical protein [Sinorhizobium/Ensifer group]OOG65738.1 hypothetical protein B0E45_26760 [Sinorhizobium sp. A49]RDL47524.1 hypothetical protein BLJAPNOD_05620 [Ensifer sp. M14]
MAMAYRTGPILRHQVDKAYRLIEIVEYPIDLAQWRSICEHDFNRRYIAPTHGSIVTVENSIGYVQGISIAHPGSDPNYGHILDVPVFIVATAADTAGVSNALLGHLKAMARADHCSYMIVANIDPNIWPDKGSDPRKGIVIPITV